ALAEVDAFAIDANLVKQLHQRARPAAKVERFDGREHLLDQRGIFRLDATACFERVIVVAFPPFAGEVLLVVMDGGDSSLGEHLLFEFADGHRCAVFLQKSSRIRDDESSTVSKYTISTPCSRQMVTCSGGSRSRQSSPLT